MPVADIRTGAKDSAGADIESVYANSAQRYAIYRTKERVLIHFGDDPEEEKRQRSTIATLNPLRGEINGLIDGWRTSENSDILGGVRAYDRRVADALVVGLEDDAASAYTLLANIKKDIVEERTSRGKRLYLVIALLTMGAIVALARIFQLIVNAFSSHQVYEMPIVAAGVGTIGAFFSIALGIRNKTVLVDLRMWDNAIDAALRVIIGAIAAAVLVTLVLCDAITISLGNVPADNASSEASQLWLMIVAFIGGFCERLVPSFLDGAAMRANEHEKPSGPVNRTKMTDQTQQGVATTSPATPAAVRSPTVTGPSPDKTVQLVQELLVGLGYMHPLLPDGSRLDDGMFGPVTRAAAESFLTAVGIVGAQRDATLGKEQDPGYLDHLLALLRDEVQARDASPQSSGRIDGT